MVYHYLVIVAFFDLLVIKMESYIFLCVMIPSASPLIFYCDYDINNDKILIFVGYLLWKNLELL